MYALYNEAENEYVGIQTWSDCDDSFVSLTRFSELDQDDPALFVHHTRERAQSLVDCAKDYFPNGVPFHSCIDEFMCEITNLAEYRVVKIGIVPE